jgi:hypothetical protein
MDERNSLQPIHPMNPMAALWSFIGGIVLIIALVAGLIAAWHTFTAGANIVVTVLIIVAIVAVPAGAIVGLAYVVKATRRQHLRAELALMIEQERLAAIEDERRRENERHTLDLQIRNRTINFDDQGNAALFDASNGRVLQLQGQYREFPNLSSYHNSPKVNRVTEEEQTTPQSIAAPAQILSFSQMLEKGVIVPGQKDILYGWEVILDENTGVVSLKEIRGGPELRQTCFVVGGMQAGKTSLVVNWAGQEVAKLDTLLCGVDPHMNAIDPITKKPERSLAYRLAPLQEAGYLAWPFAGREAKDIARVVKALRGEVNGRLGGKDTPLGGYNLTFIVDEALALARMVNTSKHDPVYDELFDLMQCCSTETAKVGITAIYMAQLSSKDQMADIDIRDACPSSVILKTPFQQAKNLKLTAEEANMANRFEKGHGFFIPAIGGDPAHFVYGAVVQDDIAKLARQLPRSPLLNAGKMYPVQKPEIGETMSPQDGSERRVNVDGTQVRTQGEAPLQANLQGKVADVLDAMAEGINTKDGIISRVWKVNKGSSKEYKEAGSEYEQVMRIISSIGRRGMEIYQSAEMGEE